jgi:hypothetical protein
MAADGFLHRYFLNNAQKRLHKWVHYFDIYERHFDRFRGKAPVMLEVGVCGGGSLQMWREYFGPDSRIVGLDIDPGCKAHEGTGIEIFIGSQDDPDVLAAILEKYPEIDIVLDDGSHVMRHMIATFEHLYPRISKTGVYMVEDTHTCYIDDYDGGVGRAGSFMEMVKGKLDEINAVHTGGVIPVSDFTRSTDAICCYDSIVTFEKRPQGMRQAPITIAL